jgi:hypothetical protein
LLSAFLLTVSFLTACAQGRQMAAPQQRRRTVSGDAQRSIIVKRGDNLQKAIDAARPGDTLQLEAGASFVGNFTLPNKGSSSDWITIRTSTPDTNLPPSTTRISPANAPLLPKLLSPGFGEAVLKTAPGAHHYRLIGIEMRTVDAAAFVYDLVNLGDGSSAQNSIEKVPHHLVLDRCLITAFPTQTLKRGIALHSAETSITGCYVAGFKSTDQDAQAIAGWNGPGPFHLINNYLEASGQNLIFGGATPSIPGLVPSEIEVRRNHFYKPLSWRAGENGYAGKKWQVKSLFELKSARGVIVEGNVFENCWGDTHWGYGAINLTVRGDSGPQATIEDFEFKNNLLRHTPNVFNILGKDTSQPSGQGRRIRIVNNMFEDVDGKRWGGDGEFLKMSQIPEVFVDHNTVMQSGNIIWVYGAANSGFVFTNNIIKHNSYGIIGQDQSPGTNTLRAYFPGARVRRNLIIGADFSQYPQDNFYPTKLAKVGFEDAAGGHYRLKKDSEYSGRATDGKDTGCDLDELNTATAGVVQQTRQR